MSKVDYYSVQEWLEAGNPLDKFFIVRRQFSTLANFLNFSLAQWSVEVTNTGCRLIKQLASYYCQESKAESFSIVPYTDLMLNTAWIYSHDGYEFTIMPVYENNFTEIQVCAVVILYGEK